MPYARAGCGKSARPVRRGGGHLLISRRPLSTLLKSFYKNHADFFAVLCFGTLETAIAIEVVSFCADRLEFLWISMRIIPSRSLLNISFTCSFSLNSFFRNVENIAENKDNFGGRTSAEVISLLRSFPNPGRWKAKI